MIDLQLNLLSPAKKKHYYQFFRFLFIKETLEFIMVACCLVAIMHLVGWLLLTATLNDLAASSLVVNKESVVHNQEIKNINALMKEFLTAGDDYAMLSPHLMQLSTTLPPDIKLNAVVLDRTNKSIVISGLAATRDSLLRYVTMVRQLTWIGSFAEPASSLFQKENINFEIRAPLQQILPVKPLTPIRPPSNRSEQ